VRSDVPSTEAGAQAPRVRWCLPITQAVAQAQRVPTWFFFDINNSFLKFIDDDDDDDDDDDSF
jgi:hypothetical protein